MTKWTQFWDMHTGGTTKLAPYQKIYIEAPEREAEIVFYNRFGRSPHRVTCTCCGEDYSLSEHDTLEQATAFFRGCAYEAGGYMEKPSTERYACRYITLDEFIKRPDVLVIRAADIKPEERA